MPSDLLFIDSVRHYSTAAHMARKWNICNAAAIVDSPKGRPGKAIAVAGMGSGIMSFAKTLDAEYSTLCMGMAYYNGAGFAGQVMLLFNRNSVVNPLTALLQHAGGGALNVQLSGGATSAATTTLMALNRWYFIEFYAKLYKDISNNVKLDYAVYFDGNPVADISGTLSDGNVGAEIPGFASFQPQCGAAVLVKDIYVTDGEVLGDNNIGAFFPNAAGDSTVWTPTPAGSNFSKVKEVDPDDLTTLVSTQNTGDEDLYQLDDILGYSGTIKGVQILTCATKSESGAASLKAELKSSGTTITDADFFPSFPSWRYQRKSYRKSPFTGLDWTIAEINALQQGIKRTS